MSRIEQLREFVHESERTKTLELPWDTAWELLQEIEVIAANVDSIAIHRDT